MTDSFIQLNVGTGGEKVASDDDGTWDWPYSKMVWGPSATQNHVEDTDGGRIPVLSYKESAIAAAGVKLTVKRASISISASGDNTIISAVASKKIRLLHILLIANASVSIQFKSATTVLSGSMDITNKGGFRDSNDLGILEGGTNENFIINLGAAKQVSGYAVYVET